MSAKPKTLQQAIVYFADADNCLKLMVERRWPNGVTCPTCGRKDVRFISTRRMWECKEKHARKQFSVKIGTIFEDSALPLDKWLIAMWMVANCKNGVSSYEVARAMGITQKSAWFMLHRIRLAMQARSVIKLGGPGSEVEVDETFVGGAARFMHADKHKRRITETGTKDKTAVMGILERGGEVRAAVVGNRKKHALQSNVRAHVKAGSAIYSDALMSYQGLKHQGFEHQVIDHAETYGDGKVHTNGFENFWSLFKRQLKGTTLAWSHSICSATSTNKCSATISGNWLHDGLRFEHVASHVIGKRLTYAEVTGKVGATNSLPN